MQKLNIRRLILFIVLFVAIVGIAYLFRPTSACVCNRSPLVEISAKQLIKEYEADETQANSAYLGKIITVKGTIASVLHGEEGKVIVEFETESLGNVNCTLCEKGMTSEELRDGAEVVIKGQCVGFTFDVVLVKCCLE